MERADLVSENEVDGNSEAAGSDGAGGSVRNLSLGSIVLKLAPRKEFIDTLLDLSERSRGTSRVLTVWPGRKGQAEVVGRVVS